MQPEGGENWLLGTARRFKPGWGGVQANLGVQLISKQAQSIERRRAAAVSLRLSLFPASGCAMLASPAPYGASCCRLAASMSGRRWISARWPRIPADPAEFGGVAATYDIARFHDQLVS